MDATEAVSTPAVGESITRNAGDSTHPEPVAVTETEVDTSIKEKPCSLDIGSKFEYCVRDVQEIGRRFCQILPQKIDGWCSVIDAEHNYNGADLSTAGAWTNSRYYSFSVYPLHPICSLYAGWSGHLKYRIVFTAKKEATSSVDFSAFKVSYVPSTRATVTQTVPVTSFTGAYPPAAGTANSTNFSSFVLQGPESFVGKTGAGTTALWNANTYAIKPHYTINMTPIESVIQINGAYAFVDISVPFSTQYNVLPTFPSRFNTKGMDAYNGRLIIQAPTSSTSLALEVYQSFGDDFRLHGFAPRAEHFSSGYYINLAVGTGVVTDPSNGQQLGQNVFGDPV